MNTKTPAASAASHWAHDGEFDAATVLARAKPDIDAANAAWLPGLRSRDAQSITSAYADDGLFIASDGTVFRGREAITAMYASRFSHLGEITGGCVVPYGFRVIDTTLIYEWGRAWIEMLPEREGDTLCRRGGEYLTVWRLAVDGHWRISRNIAL